MAITSGRKLSDFSGFLNRNQAQPIFERVYRGSVVQRLSREVPLGINGESIPVVTGKLQAAWVAEGAIKPASQGSLGLKTMDPKKIAVIAVVSSEVVRANPGSYMNLIQDQVAESFAQAFDRAALYNQAPSALGAEGTASGSPFSTYVAATNKSVEIGTNSAGIYYDFVDGLSAMVADNKRMTGFAIDARLEPLLLGAKDGNNRPLFIDTPQLNQAPLGPGDAAAIREGRLLQRPAFMGEGVYSGTTADVEAIGGDWSQVVWGVVGGIKFDVTNLAAVTINGSLVSLWENNLVAVRAEAEYGFLVNDPNAFVLYKNAV